MTRLTADDLAVRTLARQFPVLDGRDTEAVSQLFSRLGPIQSQVPRSPFLTASSRLPGVRYATMRDLFESHQLLKTSSLRGTVHTSSPEYYPWLDAVARAGHAGAVRSRLGLVRVTTADLMAEIETYADAEWRPRQDIVAHAQEWLAEHESVASAAAVTGTMAESLVWGHSGLLRRPRDDHWEKRTDIFHRRARAVRPDLGSYGFEEALTGLVRIYLSALGPATRQDLAYFFGTGRRAADAAVEALGEEVVRLPGPAEETYLDLAEPPAADHRDPGIRLLPEFDALLVGYCGRHRMRFLTERQLDQVWAKANGQFAPLVLHQGRIVATWKTSARGRQTTLDVTMVESCRPLAADLFAEPVAALEAVLDVSVADVRVRA